MATSSGGSANLRGITYQMLWSLLEASELVIRDGDLGTQEGHNFSAWIVIEPTGGGGDIRTFIGGEVTVQQIKSKSDGGPWSYTRYVEEVLPDLYKAVECFPGTTFRFVTEGRKGDWQGVEAFLASFHANLYPKDGDGMLYDEALLTPIPTSSRKLYRRSTA